MSSPVDRVRAALTSCGLDVQIAEFDQSTATSQQAADALGVPVATIVKSLVFLVNDRPVLVLASGANRVDLDKLARIAGGKAKRADAERVKAETGFAIGGVPPVGHSAPLATFIDQDLMAYPQLWAAAGSPYVVFPVTSQELVRISGGAVELRQQRE
ncbi:MAG: YbaK/EbsC family protein [Anaerolineae bacterium]